MRDEMAFHLDARVDDLVRTGLPRREAERRARMEFGGLEGWKEQCREATGAGWLDETRRSVRDAWRSARRNPGFTVIALLTLALGIGANVALFSVLHPLLLSPLPVRDPGSLYQVVLSTVRRPYYGIPHTKYQTLGEQIPVFESLFGWGGRGEYDVRSGNRSDRANLTIVTGTFFEGLGVRPALGRLIAPDDDRTGGAANVAVISHRLWLRLFDGDPAAVTRSITLKWTTELELEVRVIGVAPPEFAGAEPADPADLYVPVHAFETLRPQLLTGTGNMWMHVMGRLRPEVSFEEATSRLRDGWSRIDREAQAERGDNTRPEFMILEDGSHGYSEFRIEYSRALVILTGLVATVLLITCSNLASLLFVRAARRADEMSIRTALGATRGQLVRHWLTECLLLASAGGLAGLLAARWIAEVLLTFVPEENRPALEFQASPPVLLFSLALTLAAGLLVGLLPALRASRVDLVTALRAHATAAAHRGTVARVVLAGQIAVSLALVVGSVLFVRTLSNLNNVDAGFDRESVVVATPQFYRLVQYPTTRRREVMETALTALRGAAEFRAVAVGPPPIYQGGPGGWAWARVPGYTLAPNEDNSIYFYSVSPGYFGALSIPFIAGRDFEEQDAASRARVVIVSQRLAEHYFAGRNPTGQRLSWGTSEPVEIVGVVGDIRNERLREPPKEIVYEPMRSTSTATIIARPAAGIDADTAERKLQAVLATAAPEVPFNSGQLAGAVRDSLGRDRLLTQLSGAFGVLALLLASIGLFGSVAHWASGRTRELAIRLTLGASRWHVVRVVLAQSVSVTVSGVLVGVPLSMTITRLLDPLLFGVTTSDPIALGVAVLLLCGAGLLAASWPAVRAARLNPLDALRNV
jgi:predicted permease